MTRNIQIGVTPFTKQTNLVANKKYSEFTQPLNTKRYKISFKLLIDVCTYHYKIFYFHKIHVREIAKSIKISFIVEKPRTWWNWYTQQT